VKEAKCVVGEEAPAFVQNVFTTVDNACAAVVVGQRFLRLVLGRFQLKARGLLTPHG